MAGLIGRNGPQNKQPFMVAFFKATEVHLRSIRSTSGGGKRGNPGRSKGAKSQEALRVANVAGKRSRRPVFNLVHACKINETPPRRRPSQQQNAAGPVAFPPETKHQVTALASAKISRDRPVFM